MFDPGSSDFIVARGAGVNFVCLSESHLVAYIQSMTEGEGRFILIAAAVVIAGGLFYLSRSMGHLWLKLIRRDQPLRVAPPPPIAAPTTVDPNQGRDGRKYSN